MVEAGTSGGQVNVVIGGQGLLVELGRLDVRKWRRGVSTGEDWRQHGIWSVVGRTQLKTVGAVVGCGRLGCEAEVRTRCAVCVDDALGEQIRNSLARYRLVCREYVIEGAVLSDDHDHVLDRCCGREFCGVLCGRWNGRSEIGDERDQAGADRKVLPGLRQDTRFRHESPPER